MTATISDFFGSNFEQEVMDEVVLWEGDAPNTVKFNLSESSANFEELIFYSGLKEGNDPKIYPLNFAVFPKDVITQPTFLNTNVGCRYRNDSSFATVNVTKNSHTEFTCYADVSASWVGRIIKVVGRKRRIARVGLDELMSSMGMPNLVTNPDLNNPVNQRAFNGNWGSLAIGAYGYDQWVKTSNTHMGFVVEDGKYIPNKMHTLTVNNAVVKQVMSPASGHFVVSIPFATSGVYDFYAGEFKRPWHPPQDALSLCAQHYYITKGYYVSYSTSGAALQRTSVYFPDMRINPSITLEKTSGTMGVALGAIHQNHCVLSFSSTGVSQEWFGNVKCDASIPWSELSGKAIIAA